MELERQAALLDAVLIQLTLDSDSDHCPSLYSTESGDSRHGSLSICNSCADDLSSSVVLVEHPEASQNGNEPFPEYLDDLGNSADEKTWEELFTLAMREDIRMREVDPPLVLGFIPTESQKAPLDDIKDLLSSPKLRKESRSLFVEVTKKVILLEFTLFRQSGDFLNAEDVREAGGITPDLLDWIVGVNNQVHESLSKSSSVVKMLERIEREEVTELQRFRRMAYVVFMYDNDPFTLL